MKRIESLLQEKGNIELSLQDVSDLIKISES
jgi:hypothetical protein